MRSGWGAYPLAADNGSRSFVSRLQSLYEWVVRSRIRFSAPLQAFLPACRQACPPPFDHHLPGQPLLDLGLRPWRPSEHQHLLQRPHVVGQAGRHGWHTR